MPPRPHGPSRRTLLGAGLAAAVAPGLALIPGRGRAQDRIIVKYDWLIGNGQLGDVIAVQQGFLEEAGFAIEMSPGGPNSATVPPVVTGAAALGQFSETPQLYAARAAGVPVRMIACGFRTGPYAFASLPAKPLRSATDLVGLRIGMQPTARFVLDAIAVRNGIDPADLTVVSVGFDKQPLILGEVDAIGGWITNTQALSVLGKDRVDLMASDLGLESYANVYFATDEAVETQGEMLGRFLGAIGRGWGWVRDNPEQAVADVVAAYPELDLEWEQRTVGLILNLSFDEATAVDGWGTFDPASVERQIALLDEVGQYPDGRPPAEDCYSLAALEASADARPKLDAPGA